MSRKKWRITKFDELTEGQVITVALKGSAKRYRVKSVTHEGNTWTASVVPADLDDPEAVYWPISAEPTTEPKFDATVLSETFNPAGDRANTVEGVLSDQAPAEQDKAEAKADKKK